MQWKVIHSLGQTDFCCAAFNINWLKNIFNMNALGSFVVGTHI